MPSRKTENHNRLVTILICLSFVVSHSLFWRQPAWASEREAGNTQTTHTIRPDAPRIYESQNENPHINDGKTADPQLTAAVTDNLTKTWQDQDEEKEKGKGKKGKKGHKKEKEETPLKPGKPMIWEDRGDISKLDLYWGIGSQEGSPKPPFVFEKEDFSGTNPKIKITDANNVRWNVKFDEEVHAEVACSRIVWACGYMVEESYFIPSGRIAEVTELSRAKKFVQSDGSFTNAMFEKRPEDITRRKIRWAWRQNPFTGTKELSGLQVLAILLNNWDTKADNNEVLGIPGPNETINDWFIVSDWGGSLGKTGAFFSHSKWDYQDYSRQPFIQRITNGKVDFAYHGKVSGEFELIPVEHAKWIGKLLDQLSEHQLREAFRAAGATQAEQTGFASKIRQRITELVTHVGR